MPPRGKSLNLWSYHTKTYQPPPTRNPSYCAKCAPLKKEGVRSYTSLPPGGHFSSKVGT